ncbi:MAG TPA: RsbRD N-terminal domain-containing protein [Dissulfurispiraceae bacterium]|nr:RsbRD N-terminal domain-containing protein [Dissulfurispiraceae bacterium]
MNLKDLLSEKRPAILKRWLDVAVDTYPAETSLFLKKQKDQFSNPVGHTLAEGTEAIFDALLCRTDAEKSEKSASFLDSIIRIKAVQEGAPSQALVFIFLLKGIIRELLGQAVQEHPIAEELAELESAIDAIGLRGFDSFIKCREKIYELKANETRNITYRLLQKAQMLCEIPGVQPGVGENSSSAKPKP